MNLREHALKIWQAGVDAVNSERLVRNHVSVDSRFLRVCDQQIPLQDLRHIEVVGAGKAGAVMARGIEAALQQIPPSITLSGWVNVPADCVTSLRHIHLHAARPAGINEPTAEGMAGTAEILRRVSLLGKNDVCIVLISGGGSALLCQPVPGITLAEKQQLTRILAAAGAPIHELNCVRTQLSLVKGGGLGRASTAGHSVALVISDVIGDPLSVIASGPTVTMESTATAAMEILLRHQLLPQHQSLMAAFSDSESVASQGLPVPDSVIRLLQKKAASESENSASEATRICSVTNYIIGNNQTAVDAAAAMATHLGYQVVNCGSDHQGEAAEVGQQLFDRLQAVQRESGGQSSRVCVLSGGEPTVQLASLPASPQRGVVFSRKGGRNQELVLAAINANPRPELWRNLVLLSGGTDGEDGPTDAAGAVCDEDLVRYMQAGNVDPQSYLAINNSYPFFEQLGGLLKTGPTHTNVMDLRVGLVDCS